ncbi:MAG: hypothetical protein BroJett014_21450 [Planctomycetota bacterium]|nr:MAG: hypothetical protein BroJett014_21450 [Planctomycetota bacterium]
MNPVVAPDPAMTKTSLTAALALCLIVLIALASPKDAQKAKDDPKPGAAGGQPQKPVAIDPEELKQAGELVGAMPQATQALCNALRWLIRPELQAEVMKGRRHQAPSMPPFEEERSQPLSLAERLRLVVVLQSGLPLMPPVQQAADRLVQSPMPSAGEGLGPCAIEMVALRLLARMEGIKSREKLKARGRDVLRLADEQAQHTQAPKGNQMIPAAWFVNHYWRAVIARAAFDLDINGADKAWSSDLDLLLRAAQGDRGWHSGGPLELPYQDANSNLFALGAIALAAQAPDKLLSKGRRASAQKALELGPALLKKYMPYYGALGYDGCYGLIIAGFPRELVPADTPNAENWHKNTLTNLVAGQRKNGSFAPRGDRAASLGLHGTSDSAPGDMPAIIETSLMSLYLCGGFFAPKPPLAEADLARLGEVMLALALIEASQMRVVSDDFRQRVIDAIADGCAFLAASQLDDGHFPGHFEHYTGHQALVLLTLLHGGSARDSEPVKKGLAWLEKKEFSVQTVSYDAAIMLMLFQKYYESEIKASGMLEARTEKDRVAARKKLAQSLPKERMALFQKLVSHLDSAHTGGDGGWTYAKVGKTDGFAGGGDNSNAQYAMLGYRSAVMLGCEVKTEVFKRETQRLLKTFYPVNLDNPPPGTHRRSDSRSPDKSPAPKVTVPEEFKELSPEAGGWGYSCIKTPPDLAMTAAGGSSLAICMDELRLRGSLEKDLEKEINRRIAGLLLYLRHEYYVDESCRVFHVATGGAPLWDGCGFFYGLYSTERCCELLKVRMLPGELDWYRVGADLLCYSQEEDGTWKTDNLPNRALSPRAGGGGPEFTPQSANICMAILFLKRAAMPIITDHRKFDKSKPRTDEEDPAKAPPKKPITGK